MMSVIARVQTTRWSETEVRLRRDLAAAFRLFHHFGWDDLIFTHLTVRIPGEADHFLINPFDQTFEEITASSLLKIDHHGEIVEPSDHRLNPAGFTIHSALHMGAADAQCVMHLHTIAGTAVSCMEEGLLPLHQTALVARDLVAYHDFEGVALDADERPRLLADLGERPMMILRNHGTLTSGRSVAAAFTRMYYLERACAMQVAALSTGRPLRTPSTEVGDVTARQGTDNFDFVAHELVWPAMLRRAARIGPDFID